MCLFRRTQKKSLSLTLESGIGGLRDIGHGEGWTLFLKTPFVVENVKRTQVGGMPQ